TNLALCLITLPSGSFFSLKIHFKLIALCPLGKLASSQVLLLSIDSSSESIALLHGSSFLASSTETGSSTPSKHESCNTVIGASSITSSIKRYCRGPSVLVGVEASIGGDTKRE